MKAMQKNSKAFAFVVLLALLIATSFPAPAFAAETGTIPGDSDVNNVTINVILPTTLNFALDPLSLDVDGQNQISKQDFIFVNQTLAPVKVSISITATAANNVTLVSTTSALAKDDTSVTDKKLFFGALGATGLTGTTIAATGSAVTTTSATNVITTYEAIGDIYGSSNPPEATYSAVSATADTLVAFTPNSNGTTGAALISFALDKAIESATPGVISDLAADDAGVAAFEFYGELNTYADWQANDLTVSGAYTLTPLRGATYDGYVADSMIAGSLNQMEPPVVAPTYTTSGFIVNGATVATLATTVQNVSSDAVDINIPFYFASKTIQTLQISGAAVMTTLQTTDSAISGDNLVLKKGDANNTFRKSAVGVKNMVLTLSDSSVYRFTVTTQ